MLPMASPWRSGSWRREPRKRRPPPPPNLHTAHRIPGMSTWLWPGSGREAHSPHSFGVNNCSGQEHGWGRPWAPPPGSLPPPPVPQGPPADSLDPLHCVPHLHSCQQPLQLSLGLTPGHCDSRPPILSLCPGTGCASSGWGGGAAGKGSSLTRGSARGSMGDDKCTGQGVWDPGKGGGTNSRQAAALASPTQAPGDPPTPPPSAKARIHHLPLEGC